MRAAGVAARAATVLTLLCGALAASPVSAQSGPLPATGATVTEVSPWVAAEGEWQVELTLNGTPPAGSSLRYTIHQPLPRGKVRGELSGIVSGGDLGPSLHNAVSVPLDTVLSADTVDLTVAVRSRSGSSDRVLLPNPGIHPVEIELVDNGGSPWFRQVLFLNRLPVSNPPPPLRVAPVIEVQAPPLIGPTGAYQPGTGLATTIDQASTLIEAAPTAPLSILIDPQLLVALPPAERGAIQRLVDAVGARPLLQTPSVPVDLSAIATSGGLGTLKASITAAQRTLEHTFHRPPTSDAWPFDPTLSQGTEATLRALGVEHLLLHADQLVEARPSLDTFAGQRIRIGSESGDLDALVADAAVASRLGDIAASSGLAVHLALTELVGIWFELPDRSEGGTVVDLSSVRPEVVRGLLAFFDGTANAPDGATENRPLRSASLRDALAAAPLATTTVRRRTTPVVRQLIAGQAPSLGPIATALERLRRRARSYHSTIADPSDVAPLDEFLFTIQHRGLSPADQLHSLAAADNRITETFSRIVAPPPRSFTVTARRARLPMRITNNTGRTATVLLRFAGRRLEVNGGHALRLVLQPGPNAVSIPVLARTSGDFTVRVEIRTADDQLGITATSINVRSKVVSGVGVFLGGGALLFLVIWWIVTIRRGRAGRRAMTEAPPPEQVGPVA